MTSARKQLIDEERITPDNTRYQLKLNRDGHYAAINLRWVRETKKESQDTGRPEDENCISTRRLRDNKQALLVDRNQKEPGVSTKQDCDELNPNDIQCSDLRSIERLGMLFKKQLWLRRTKPNFLFFVSCAVKAKGARNPEGLFVWLVKNNKSDYVQMIHESQALREIREYLNGRRTDQARNDRDAEESVIDQEYPIFDDSRRDPAVRAMVEKGLRDAEHQYAA